LSNRSLSKRRAVCYDIATRKEIYVQADLFEETLEKKILRLEKWIGRLHKDLYWLKGVYELHMQVKQQKAATETSSPQQLSFLSG
jgi:hypothetical protein